MKDRRLQEPRHAARFSFRRRRPEELGAPGCDLAYAITSLLELNNSWQWAVGSGQWALGSRRELKAES